jgi:hypothetical protein
MKTTPETITWHHLPDTLPDCDINVLLSTTSDCDTAYWTGERWLWAWSGGECVEKALAWCHIPKGLSA